METHYKKIVEDTDKRVQKALRIQIQELSNPDDGGFPDEYGVIQAKYAIYRVVPMISAYYCMESCFYQKKSLISRILSGLKFVERCQHSNGLFDYVLCNFNSAPDTAFCMKKLIPCYEYLVLHKNGEQILHLHYSQFLPVNIALLLSLNLLVEKLLHTKVKLK